MNLLIRYLLIASAFTPLIVFKKTLFPFIFSKTLFLRGLVELIVVFFLIHLIVSFKKSTSELRNLKVYIRHPLFIGIGLLSLSLFVSTIFADNSYRAFWGDLERGEGLFTLLHLGVLFLFMLSFFEKEDWMRFFKTSLFVGFIVAIIAMIQHTGIGAHLLPQWIDPSTFRPGSTLENPAFMSAYLIFIVGLSLLVCVQYPLGAYKKIFSWPSFSLLTFIVSIIAIFISRTRGALLGLGAGFLFLVVYGALSNEGVRYFLKNRMWANIRNFCRVLVLFVIVVGTIFVITRNALLWQKIPGLDRLAQLNFRDASVQTRRVALGSSWRAFLERPLVGWGVENYKVAYAKHYDPEYARAAETWFDRAHNRIVDVGVMQGVFGLVVYLGIWILLFYTLFKKSTILGRKNAVIIAATFITYFIQNLFLFDMPVTYIMQLVLLGFIITKTSEENSISLRYAIKPLYVRITQIGSILFLGFLIYIFYAYNYIPYTQTATYKRLIDSKNGEKILAESSRFLSPYNYTQQTIRFFLIDTLYASDVVNKKQFEPLIRIAVESMDEVVNKEPGHDPRYLIILAEVFNEKGKEEEKFLDTSIHYLERARELSPYRQDVFYLLAFAYAGKHRNDEAIALTREAVNLSPLVGRAHFNLGLHLVLAGRKHWVEGEAELVRARELGLIAGPNFVKEISNFEIIYKKMLLTYVRERDLESVLRVAKAFKEVASEDLHKDLDTLVGLARMGRWEEIDIIFHVITPEEEQAFDFNNLLFKYIKEKNKERLLAVLDEYKKTITDVIIKEDLDILMELARQGKWEIIENTFIDK